MGVYPISSFKKEQKKNKNILKGPDHRLTSTFICLVFDLVRTVIITRFSSPFK